MESGAGSMAGTMLNNLGTMSFLASCGAASYIAGYLAHPQRYSEVQGQTPAQTSQEPTFGSAADANTIFTPQQAVSKQASLRSKPGQSRYDQVRWMTMGLDYGLLIVTFSFFNSRLCGENWSPVASLAFFPITLTGVILLDFLKAWLFSDVLAEAKLEHLKKLRGELVDLLSIDGVRSVASFLGRIACGEGIVRDFQDKNEARYGVLFHIFYYVKTVFFVGALSTYGQAAMGLFSAPLLTDVVAVYGAGKWWELHLTVASVVYLEYLFMSFIKDALSMNILHQMMHKQWYGMHKVHHMPMKELSLVNVSYFDIPDLIIENVGAPMILLAVKLLANPSGSAPTLHMLSYTLLALTDSLCHSICPYSVTFFNPVLDALLNCNISHQLHHALNTGHYTVWPWHQLKGISHYDAKSKSNVDGSVELEMKTYNTIFNTHFPY